MEEIILEIRKLLDEHKGGAFPAAWCSMLNERFMSFNNEICKANGAVLVRGKPPKE